MATLTTEQRAKMIELSEWHREQDLIVKGRYAGDEDERAEERRVGRAHGRKCA